MPAIYSQRPTPQAPGLARHGRVNNVYGDPNLIYS